MPANDDGGADWRRCFLRQVHKQSQAAWNGIPMEQLLVELRQIQQFLLLYPPLGEKGPAACGERFCRVL